MARGQHRFRNRRLRGVRSNNSAVRAKMAPVKRKAAARRDVRLKSLVKAQLAAGKPLSAAAQSWVSAQAGRPFTKLTAEQVAKTVA
jgi:ribosome assembly protein YihI (activator of Der GTPase)